MRQLLFIYHKLNITLLTVGERIGDEGPVFVSLQQGLIQQHNTLLNL